MIYFDVLLLENFLLDLGVLLAVGFCRGYRIPKLRLAAAALTGSLLGSLAVCLIRHFMLYLLLVAGLINPVMLWIAYGYGDRRRWARDYVLMSLWSLLLGGLVGAADALFPQTFPGLLLPGACIGLLAAVLLLSFQKKQKTYLVETACMVEKQVRQIMAWQDTGNLLRDPVSGMAVCIVSEKYLKLWALERETMIQVPYETLSGDGRIPVVPVEFFYIKRDGEFVRQPEMLLGFGPAKLFQGKEYQMILHETYCL